MRWISKAACLLAGFATAASGFAATQAQAAPGTPASCAKRVGISTLVTLPKACRGTDVTAVLDGGGEVQIPAAGDTIAVETLRTNGASTTRIHTARDGSIAVKRDARRAIGEPRAVTELEALAAPSSVAAPDAAATAAVAGCGSSTSVPTHMGRFVDSTYHWLYNPIAQPDSGAHYAIKAGMDFMTADASPCGTAATSARTSYDGSTTLRNYGVRDSHNVVGWATFGASNTLAMAYWYYSDSTNARIVEADIAFNQTMPWTTSLSGTVDSTRYDVIGVAAHEVGHVLGLDHAVNDGAAVMAPSFSKGENRRFKRLGDLWGIRRSYPQ